MERAVAKVAIKRPTVEEFASTTTTATFDASGQHASFFMCVQGVLHDIPPISAKDLPMPNSRRRKVEDCPLLD